VASKESRASSMLAWVSVTTTSARQAWGIRPRVCGTSMSTGASAAAAVKPLAKPASGCFSSGPCKKRPGYVVTEALSEALLGRSHRAPVALERIQLALSETKRLLRIPEDYRVAIVPASDTGAMEMVMWSMLGPRPVDVCWWESFGQGWATDILKELRLEPPVREISAEYGSLPDLATVDPAHDVVFTWNGTTSGVCVPPGAEWISDTRTGITICDATSAVFAMDMPWNKIDVLTYSWQKVLGGEAAHGMLVLSPRAVERLESFDPPRPVPKIFRMTKKGKINEGLFQGSVINTVSMMCVEDYLDALRWVDSIGGLEGTMGRSRSNLAVFEDFVAKNDWIDFLAADPQSRSSTSVCFKFNRLDKDQVKRLTKLLEKEEAAFDIGSYRDAPPGIRVWCGATVEAADLKSFTEWLAWAHEYVLLESK